MVSGRPNPQKRPNRVKSKKANPAAGMNRILMGMISLLGDVIRNVVNRDQPVGKNQHDKDQKEESEPAEKVHGDELELKWLRQAKFQLCSHRKNAFPKGETASRLASRFRQVWSHGGSADVDLSARC